MLRLFNQRTSCSLSHAGQAEILGFGMDTTRPRNGLLRLFEQRVDALQDHQQSQDYPCNGEDNNEQFHEAMFKWGHGNYQVSLDRSAGNVLVPSRTQHPKTQSRELPPG
jgi:hypothetical protein